MIEIITKNRNDTDLSGVEILEFTHLVGPEY